MQRSSFGPCPAHWLIRQLGDRWSVPVLSTLSSEPRRFFELCDELSPISSKMLDSTLKKLMRIGFVRRSGVHTQTVYELTELGVSARPAVQKLLRWPLDQGVALFSQDAGQPKS